MNIYITKARLFKVLLFVIKLILNIVIKLILNTFNHLNIYPLH